MEGMILDVEKYMENLVETLERTNKPLDGPGATQYMKMLNLQRSALPMRDCIACNLGLVFNEMSRTALEKQLANRRNAGLVKKWDPERPKFVVATLPTYRDQVGDL